MIRTGKPDPTSALNRDVLEQPPANEQMEVDYFKHTKAPEYLDQIEAQVRQFLQKHMGKRRIAVVTSGGTTVPLENNTVRFIDNFSAGTRGAISTEEFLEQGYAVIFLHREFSLLPYSRHFSHTTNCFLDFMDVDGSDGTGIGIKTEYKTQMLETLKKYRYAKDNELLLLLPYTTVNQYLYTLRTVALGLNSSECPEQMLFYLAAAVSDFFLPSHKLSEHKIQSNGEKLVIDLDPVPKFLRRLVETWIPGAMIVSFKLETDQNLLLDKCKLALHRYGHQLVIGNLLQTRKHEVLFVTSDSVKKVSLSERQIADAVEIESVFIPNVIELHDTYCAQSA